MPLEKAKPPVAAKPVQAETASQDENLALTEAV